MTLEQLYESLHSDFDKTLERLQKRTLMERLLQMFSEDLSMENLQKAVEAKDANGAFLAAHTLKGVALNLGFSPLAENASELTELLREREFPPAYRAVYDRLCKEYARTLDYVTECIRSTH